MEFLARLLGSEWRAPELEDEDGGCDEEQRGECRNEFGEEGLAWACEHCKRRPS